MFRFKVKIVIEQNVDIDRARSITEGWLSPKCLFYGLYARNSSSGLERFDHNRPYSENVAG